MAIAAREISRLRGKQPRFEVEFERCGSQWRHVEMNSN